MAILQKIAPCLWYATEAEEAANHYVSIFENSRVVRVLHYGEAGHEIHGQPAGSVLTVEFELDGQRFVSLNGGPQFKFTEAISLEVSCANQEEVDYFWERLAEGGEEGPCGWLKDRYGLSWQVTPVVLNEMMADPDREKTERLMTALLEMKKLDLAALQRAFDGP